MIMTTATAVLVTVPASFRGKRRATAWQAAQLIATMHKDGLTLISEAASWLNANAMTVLV